MQFPSPQSLINYFYEEVINRQRLDVIDAIVDPDFVEHVPFPGQGPGREGLKTAVGMLLKAFPDIRWQQEEQIVEGDKVVSRFSWTGTHRDVFLGIPATGRTVKVWGVVIDEVKDGRFAESRIIMDIPGLLQQLQG